MVFVFDEGAVYDAPIDKIWKLNMAHGSSMAKIHPGAKDPKFEQFSDTVFQASYGTDIGGQTVQIAVKLLNLLSPMVSRVRNRKYYFIRLLLRELLKT